MLIGELVHRFRINISGLLFSGLLVFGVGWVLTQSIRAAAQTAGGSVTPAAAPKAPKVAADATKKDAAKAAEGGIALKATTNVNDNVNTQVVLLPRPQAERVFSKEIARRYAVVQVTIDNKSKDAAFVLHSIFADYSGWALSGVPSWFGVPSTLAASGASAADPCPQGQGISRATDSQTISCAGQVASIESRVIRGELQDASTWTWRNGVIRAAVLVGAVASGIPAFGSKNALKYVGAYNGQLVPGTEVFWPDGTVTQLNRVSDFGFQTNKIIAKAASDIVYAFFPLDRFFTPGMKRIFLNAPAVFFAPAQIFVDKHIGKHCWKPGNCLPQSDVDDMKNLIEDLAINACTAEGTKVLCPPARSRDNQEERDEKMLQLLTMDCSGPSASRTDGENAACKIAVAAQKLINHISLNSTNILVQGVMTVDVATVPAAITDLTFDEGNNSPAVWTGLNTDHAATMTGSFLTDGEPTVTGIEVPTKTNAQVKDYLDTSKISVVSDGSTDTKLNFKIQWTAQIPSGSKLHFQVTKYDPKDTKKASGVKSMDYVFAVNYVETPAAANNVAKPTPADNKQKP